MLQKRCKNLQKFDFLDRFKLESTRKTNENDGEFGIIEKWKRDQCDILKSQTFLDLF